jgi:hypothetical protein
MEPLNRGPSAHSGELSQQDYRKRRRARQSSCLKHCINLEPSEGDENRDPPTDIMLPNNKQRQYHKDKLHPESVKTEHASQRLSNTTPSTKLPFSIVVLPLSRPTPSSSNVSMPAPHLKLLPTSNSRSPYVTGDNRIKDNGHIHKLGLSIPENIGKYATVTQNLDAMGKVDRRAPIPLVPQHKRLAATSQCSKQVLVRPTSISHTSVQKHQPNFTAPKESEIRLKALRTAYPLCLDDTNSFKISKQPNDIQQPVSSNSSAPRLSWSKQSNRKASCKTYSTGPTLSDWPSVPITPWDDEFEDREISSSDPGAINGKLTIRVLKPKPIFRGPWMCSTSSKFEKPFHKQTRCGLFNMPIELLEKIIPLEDVNIRVRISRTCQKGLALMASLVTIWDENSTDFCGAETSEHSARSITVITNVSTNSPVEFDEVIEDDLRRCKLLTLSLANNFKHFRSLEIYQSCIVTVPWLGMVLPQLPNLENLGIYQCHLITFCHAPDLLWSIPRRKVPLSLDFWPRNNPFYRQETVELRVAIPAFCYQISKAAKQTKIDIFRHGGAFQRFLLRLDDKVVPGLTRMLPKIIANRQDAELTVWMHNLHLGRGKTLSLDPKSNVAKFWECESCDLRLRGCFFARNQLTDNLSKITRRICKGCALGSFLTEEMSEKRFWRKRYGQLESWFTEGNLMDLDVDGTWENMLGLAKQALNGKPGPREEPSNAWSEYDKKPGKSYGTENGWIVTSRKGASKKRRGGWDYAKS